MDGIELAEATIGDLQERMASGELSAERLVEAYMARVGALDRAPDGTRAVMELNPQAPAIAAARDRERALGAVRGPLHGIPVLLKDNIDTDDMMHTTAGSLAMADSHPAADAPLVARLRDAGAVLLGKAGLTEWANFMTEGMPNGYSSRGGQVRNPYGPGRLDVGGSSSGSGAAVAANLVVVAVGTETSGSILSPATQNSVVGVKPTVGLISRRGVVPISFSQDTAGPLARTVRDAALLLGALAGADSRDPITATSAGHPTDYAGALDPGALAGARLGVPRGRYWELLSDARKAVMEAALADLRRLGAELVDPVPLSWDDRPWTSAVLTYEFKPALNAYLRGRRGAEPRSLGQLIAYNLGRPGEMLRFGQTQLLRSEETSGTLLEEAYLSARREDLRLSRREGIDRALDEHGLSALVFCAATGAAIAARAGYPSVCVPAGYAPDGEPVGLTFTASAYAEKTLLSLAYAFEQATRRRVPPLAPSAAAVPA